MVLLSVSCSIPYSGNKDVDLRTDVFVGRVDGYHTYRIPALIVTARGTVLAFCEGRRRGEGDGGDIDLLLKRSVDGGKSWSDRIVVHEEAGSLTIGNPCPIHDERTGVTHLLFTRNNKRLFYTRSTDDGETWAEPKEHTGILKGFEYPLVRIGTGPGHGIQLKSGRLVAPVWVSDRERRDKNKNPSKNRFQSGIIYSDDHGTSWHAGGLVPPEISRLNESTVLERGDGSLLLNMRAHGAGFRALSESKDGGKSWSVPELEPSLPCPTCQASMLRLSDKDVLFANPAVSRKGKPNNKRDRRRMTVRLSRDDGRTWPHSRVLDKGPSGYCDLAVLKDDSILCLYERGQKVYNQKISIARFPRAWLLETGD